MPLISEKQVREINYLNRDFDGIKGDLIDYVKRNFPDDFQDFNEASGGMALIELIAYIGDMLSFYTDRQVNESFITRAIEEKNVMALSKAYGYKPFFEVPSVVNLSVSATMVASTSGSTLFTLKKGSRAVTNFEPQQSFEILEDVDFSLTTNRTVTTDGSNVEVSISSVSAAAGQSKVFNYSAGTVATPFLKLELPDADITEIVSISASDGNEYFQVDYLAQETVFKGEPNTTSTSGDTPFVLVVTRVPRRFVVEPEPDSKLSIRFGSGTLVSADADIIPNPEDFVLPPSLRGSVSGFTPQNVDSSNFLRTKSLGVAPRNVDLAIAYRYGGGLDTNVGSRTITRLRDVNTEFATANITSVSGTVTDAIINSLSVSNTEPAGGGKDKETIDEIRYNAIGSIPSKISMTTLQDYQVRVMSMPPKFGTIFRSSARKDPTNNLGVEILLLGQDGDGYLAAPGAVLKNNIETYLKQFKSFSDSIKLTDGDVINIGVEFAVVPEPGVNINEALLEGLFILRNELDIANSNFNDTIVLPDISALIQASDKIRSVASLKIFNRTGTVDGRTYSTYAFEPASNTNNGIVSFPENSIWEVKFLNDDIVGRAV